MVQEAVEWVTPMGEGIQGLSSIGGRGLCTLAATRQPQDTAGAQAASPELPWSQGSGQRQPGRDYSGKELSAVEGGPQLVSDEVPQALHTKGHQPACQTGFTNARWKSWMLAFQTNQKPCGWLPNFSLGHWRRFPPYSPRPSFSLAQSLPFALLYALPPYPTALLGAGRSAGTQ